MASITDILKSCDSATLNLAGNLLLVRAEALQVVKDPANPFLITAISVVDPATGVYPVGTSDYKPVKAEWFNNSVNQNYEVVEGGSIPDSFIQTIGKVVLFDSESAIGKQKIKALNCNLWKIVAKLSGVGNQNDTFHVFGVNTGLKFVVEATAAEFGNRVNGMFKTPTGGEEPTPNGSNLLVGTFVATNTLFNQRLSPVVIP